MKGRFWFQGYIFEDISELAHMLKCDPRRAIIKAVRFYLSELRKTG
jgi:hypothetical protein